MGHLFRQKISPVRWAGLFSMLAGGKEKVAVKEGKKKRGQASHAWGTKYTPRFAYGQAWGQTAGGGGDRWGLNLWAQGVRGKSVRSLRRRRKPVRKYPGVRKKEGAVEEGGAPHHKTQSSPPSTFGRGTGSKASAPTLDLAIPGYDLLRET